MLEKLTFKFGSKGLSNHLSFEPTRVNLFIGPNNSGKSKAISEIESFINHGRITQDFVIFNKINFTIPSISEFIKTLNKYSISNSEIDERYTDLLRIEKIKLPSNNLETKNINVGHITLNLEILNSNSDITQSFAANYASLFSLFIAGNTRFDLLASNPTGTLQDKPKNYMSAVFQDDNLLDEIRQTIYNAFKKYLYLDPTTNLGQLYIKFSDEPPPSDIIERGIHKQAVDFHKKGILIDKFSDGVKAFTSIVMSVKAIRPNVLIIDEPEAFLHPSLADMLGKEIGTTLIKNNMQFYAATHSSDFLMGLVASGVQINLIRLTYLNEFPTARILPKEKIVKLMRDPLLRSAGVLKGLFYEAVIVTEADTDRAFYQEINERLLTFKSMWGIKNCLFLNAQNKQTVYRIIKPLRELGIPAIGIVDIDVLKEGGKVWRNLTSGAFIPPAVSDSLNGIRGDLKNKYDEIKSNDDKDMKRDGGVKLLSGNDKNAFNDFCDQLQDYGIFVIRNGELESWLENLEISGHGPDWLVKMFEQLKEDPNDIDYVKPSENDVWKFISQIKKWIDNPERKGVPNEDY